MIRIRYVVSSKQIYNKQRFVLSFEDAGLPDAGRLDGTDIGSAEAGDGEKRQKKSLHIHHELPSHISFVDHFSYDVDLEQHAAAARGRIRTEYAVSDTLPIRLQEKPQF